MHRNVVISRQVHVGPDVVLVASVLADYSRAAMLDALLGGAELSAGDLARLAEVSPATASAHLSRLLEARFVTLEPRGRQRLYRLASPQVARLIETMARLAPVAKAHTSHQREAGEALSRARFCYDHLAGKLGVAVFDALVRQRAVTRLSTRATQVVSRKVHGGLGHVRLGPAAMEVFGRLGVDVEGARDTRRQFAIACDDWSEHRPHLAGALGAALAQRAFAERWLSRVRGSRAVRVTDRGRVALRASLGLDLA